MNYMLDKINKLPNQDVIKKAAEKIVKQLKSNKDLNNSEKLLAIELAVAQLNYDLYNISGDNKTQP